MACVGCNELFIRRECFLKPSSFCWGVVRVEASTAIYWYRDAIMAPAASSGVRLKGASVSFDELLSFVVL